MAIVATADDMYLNATNAGPNGTVVAIVSGVQQPTKGYHFTPNALFVFVVNAGIGSSSTWDLYKIPNGSNSHAKVDTGVFRECTPGNVVYWTESAATFAECNKIHHALAAPFIRNGNGAASPIAPVGIGNIDLSFLHGVLSVMSAPYNGETSGWMTCDSGCCTMEQT